MTAIILGTITLVVLLAGLAIAFKIKQYTTLQVRPKRYEQGQDQKE